MEKNQFFIKKWTRHNRSWYEGKGYQFTNYSDKFLVSAEDLSKGAKDVVNVQCDYCKETIPVGWKDYYAYINKYDIQKYACQHCRQQKTSDLYRENRILEQYNRAFNFCNMNNYKMITTVNELYNCYSEVIYVCPIHGETRTNLLALTQGHGCRKCKDLDVAIRNRLSVSEVETLFHQYNGILLNANDYIGWGEKNLQVVCPECGEPFLTSLNSFIKHEGQRCPNCTDKESKGERCIRVYLENHQISYVSQQRFDDCKYKATLPFDFYIPDRRMAIEYDGEFHYYPIIIGDMTKDEAIENLFNTQRRDDIKTHYCLINDINLIRIPYWDYDNIEIILEKHLFT